MESTPRYQLGFFQLRNVFPFALFTMYLVIRKGVKLSVPQVFSGKVYNRSTEPWSLNFTVIRDPENWQNVIWSKDMTKTLTANSNGQYSVKQIAETLWNRLVADGLKNFGTLERAHIYALLADDGHDLGLRFKNAGLITNENTALSTLELETNPAFIQTITDMAESTVAIDSNDVNERTEANEKINLAISFIGASPYMFLQEGR